jgi:hypothetical protein
MDKPHLKLILLVFTSDMKASHCGLLDKDRCPCVSHAWYHEDMNPHLSGGGRNCTVHFACRAAAQGAVKEGSAMALAVNLAGLSPQRPGFDFRSVSVILMARSIVTTPPSPPEEVCLGQLQPCYSQNI